jgi:hypothetical protein
MVQAGGRIPLPEGVSRPGGPSSEVMLYSTFAAPLISQQEAMQAVADLGVPWALGGEYNGKTVTVAAWYGCVSFGRPGNPSQLWPGAPTIRLKDGQVLDRIEYRAMWLIDYGNVVAHAAGSSATPGPEYNHAVYAIDAQTRTVLLTWFYQEH